MWVQISELGISFDLPQGWLGAFKQEGEQAVVILGSNTVEGVGLVIFMKNQAPAQVVAGLNDAQALGGGVVLLLDGQVKAQGTKVSARRVRGTPLRVTFLTASRDGAVESLP